MDFALVPAKFQQGIQWMAQAPFQNNSLKGELNNGF
jgi:hypothetical protein